MGIDFSTLNEDEVKKLKPFAARPSIHIGGGMGSGCYGDPPGFPTYFLRHVYTQYGNEPRYKNAPQEVIRLGDRHFVTERNENWKPGETHESRQAKRDARMLKLWKPLPFAHERVQLWVRHVYQHSQHCYMDLERPEYGRPGTLIFPVPGYKLKSFHDEARFNDAYRKAERAAVDAFNKCELDRAAQIAVPENHQGYLRVKRFYPAHVPDLALIANPPALVQADWWERCDAKPTSGDECNAIFAQTHACPRDWSHTETYCTLCGHRSADEKPVMV